MKHKIIASIFSIAFLSIWGGANVQAREAVPEGEIQPTQPGTRSTYREAVETRTTVRESLGSGVAVDLYRVSCNAECIQVDVSDTGPNFDTRFKVELNGSSPGFIGNASAFNPTGSVSNYVEVCSGQNVNAMRRAYVSFSEVNAVGPETYDTLITCRTAGGGINGSPTIIKVLDQ